MWQFANFPTAFMNYTDQNEKAQFMFGDATGQCYQLDQTATSDNGAAIPTEMVY